MNAAAPATPKQVSYLLSLASERDMGPNLDLRALVALAKTSKGITAGAASEGISQLVRLPRRDGSKDEPARPGYYLLGEDVYVVVIGKKGGKAYAKRLFISGGHGRWDYAPGMVYRLSSAQPLSIQEAAAMGRLHGVCMVCGKQLIDPKSVQAGIGPVCSKKLAF